MPVKIPDNLPAVAKLMEENIFVLPTTRAESQDIRELKIGILNLMPLKDRTETDFLRLISNSPLQVDVDLIETASYRGSHTPVRHMDKFYKSWPMVKNCYYDGFIITGAPVEDLEFEDVSYWSELTEIMDWCRTHVTSTLYICWGALAGLYHHFGINKHPLSEKISGVYNHRVLDLKCPLFRGFDDIFLVPHSRHSGINTKDIIKENRLSLLSDSPEAGAHCIMTEKGKEIFVTGHAEYSPDTLDFEYKRDYKAGLNPKIPQNYYIDDNPDKGISVRWRAHANLFFSNWLNYYVYQETPYNWNRKGSEAN